MSNLVHSTKHYSATDVSTLDTKLIYSMSILYGGPSRLTTYCSEMGHSAILIMHRRPLGFTRFQPQSTPINGVLTGTHKEDLPKRWSNAKRKGGQNYLPQVKNRHTHHGMR